MPEVAATVPATPDRFSEIDVSDWLIAGDETLGTKPKKWLRHPDTGERWLMKYVTGNRNADGSEYPKGDDWSERVANGVALRLEIPAARTELLPQPVIGGDRLASTFDHASSLGFLLADERRRQHLETTDQAFTPESYADRAKSKFAGKPHPVDVAAAALARCGPGVSDYWLNRCSEVDNLVEPIWLVPQHRMSETARQFAEKVLRRNCARLLEGFARFV